MYNSNILFYAIYTNTGQKPRQFLKVARMFIASSQTKKQEK